VRVSFEKNPNEIFVLTHGRQPEKEYDARCSVDVNHWEEPSSLKSAKAWTPSDKVWGIISQSVDRTITVRLYGLENTDPSRTDPREARLASQGQVAIRVSKDPVGAPIFYRDVPLMPNRNVKGVIEPISLDAFPLICWRLRDLRKSESRVVLKSMPTCGNCHSFSNDGKFLGMDMDGPSGDKGAYAIAPVQKLMNITQTNVISWNAFHRDRPTFGLFSRVSPDGRYVISGVDESVYVANYLDFRFLQTFYPTRSILAMYDRHTREIKALPGADDPQYVQANAVWSPDGRTIVFARAPAKPNYEADRPLAQKANDANENQIRYDLCTIPFNNGQGGVPQPLAGASNNGKSNSFPKYSPDGKWIVFVQANNGLLMRPDSELYIIPAAGGKARRLNCNTSLMNSWHSWSPNSRWLVFSSKHPKPFTVMYLTHIDAGGNDSPAVLIPNSTAYNRAVNIPEFVNIPPDGLEEITVPAVEYKIHLDAGEEFVRKKEYDRAIAVLEKARELKPEYPKTLDALGYALSEKGDLDEAIRYFQKSIEIDRYNIDGYIYLGAALVKKRDYDGALKNFDFAVNFNPMNFKARAGLAGTLAIRGNLEEAIPHFEKALEIDPDSLDNRYNFGLTLNSLGRFREAIDQFTFVLGKNPQDAKAHSGLAVALNRTGDTPAAIQHYEEALKISPDDLNAMNNLAWILATASDPNLRNGSRALELAQKLNEATEYKIAGALDTLAAALAQAGKLEDAVKWAARALEMTDPLDPNGEMRSKLLELYKGKKPF
ncbi:MAG: tetratricopeptide repeat protein, partial [Candidatus Aminicenantes bacterium]|nr:tetratricopeptide repeat protein [Candidatus Aminicenantes bacterium]